MVFLLVSIVFNLIGVVVCHRIARVRGAHNVVFWTTMGVVLGPFAIPFALRLPDLSERASAATST